MPTQIIPKTSNATRLCCRINKKRPRDLCSLLSSHLSTKWPLAWVSNVRSLKKFRTASINPYRWENSSTHVDFFCSYESISLWSLAFATSIKLEVTTLFPTFFWGLISWTNSMRGLGSMSSTFHATCFFHCLFPKIKIIKFALSSCSNALAMILCSLL